MELLVMLWCASIVGAGCFFVSGLATQAAIARRRSTSADEPGVAPVDEESRRRAHAAELRAAELERTVGRLQHTVDAEAARARGLQEELGTMRGSLEGAEQRTRKADRARELAERIVADRDAAVLALQRETAGLKTEALRVRSLEQQVATLTSELATARAAAVPAAPVKHRKPSLAPAKREATVEASLSARLGTFADECGYDVVVLSDAQGLLLAGVGDEQTQGTVAALSSIAQELTTRAAEFVALRPVLLEVTDDEGRTLRVRLFEWEQEPLALASFGVRHTEPSQEEETVITVFPTLMAAS